MIPNPLDSEDVANHFEPLRDAAHSLFSSSTSPEEVVKIRDDIIDCVAEGASRMRQNVSDKNTDTPL